MARIKQEATPEIDVQDIETVKEDKPVIQTVKTVKKKKTFTDSDYILCRSVCFGGLNVICASGNRYEFTDYGKDCEINYRDLVALVRKGSEHVFLPRFVILDDDFLEDFPTVKKVYDTMYTVNDLKEILRLPIHQMKSEINALPYATRDVLQQMIASEIANGGLDSISKVRVLSEIFNSDFNLISELFVK